MSNVNHTITLGSIIGILTVIGTFITIMMHSRKVRRENEADARARTDEIKTEIRVHNDSVEKRLNSLEAKSADFMPRGEIENKIEHEKGNRTTADQGLKHMVDRHGDSITEIRVDLGRMNERHANLATSMEETKGLVKELGRDIGARLDKMNDLITARGAG